MVGRRSRLLVLAGAMALLACAHAASERAGLADERGATAAKQPERVATVIVTGSRIPQRVDPVTGLPQSYAPLRIYSSDALFSTGREGDLGSALRQLDPSITLHR